nr:C-type lectin domain containing protein [Haemonchus contortus]
MLSFLLLLLLLGVISQFAEAACPYGGIQAFNPNQCYIISNIETTWTSAESVCGYLGGHLVSIQSDSENDYVARVLHANSYTSFSDIYIGAYVSGGTWKWSDYTVNFAYANFKGAVTVDTDDVGSLILSRANFGQWNILSSSYLPKPHSFACQVPNCYFNAESRRESLKKLLETAYYDSTTSYYYFGTPAEMMVFSDAEHECKKIGGHLPSISNAYDNAAVQNAAYNILRGPGTGGKVILGYSNLMMNGFTWSDGNPSRYTNWAPGEPVTVVPGVAWMDILTGQWNTAAPTATSNFLCALPANRVPCS